MRPETARTATHGNMQVIGARTLHGVPDLGPQIPFANPGANRCQKDLGTDICDARSLANHINLARTSDHADREKFGTDIDELCCWTVKADCLHQTSRHDVE